MAPHFLRILEGALDSVISEELATDPSLPGTIFVIPVWGEGCKGSKSVISPLKGLSHSPFVVVRSVTHFERAPVAEERRADFHISLNELVSTANYQ